MSMVEKYSAQKPSKTRDLRVGGFTIVELLIVIVVIAVLAAITLVAYNGIRSRAQLSAMQAVASQASKKAAEYAVYNGETYPMDLATFLSYAKLTSTADKTYEYQVSSDFKNYCISVYDTTNISVAFAASNKSGGTVAGRCIRNYARNPSFETSATSTITEMGGANTDSSRTTSSAWAAAGTNSSLVTKTVVTGAPKGTRMDITPTFVVGDVVNWMYTIKNNTSTTRDFVHYGERPSPTYAALTGASTCQAVASGGTVAIRGGYTITASNTGVLGVGNLSCGANGSMSIGESYAIDAFVVTINQPLPLVYVDGNSLGWSWDGTANASTSFGPAILQ